MNEEENEGDPIIEEEMNIQRFNLNKKLFYNIFSYNKFNIEYDQSKNPSSLYSLTIEYLKKIASIDSTLPDNTELKISLTNLDFHISEDNPLNNIFYFEVNIASKYDSNILFNFEFNLEINFIPTLYHCGLNFILLGKNIKNININSKPDIIDENLIKEWIENTFLTALGNNEYNLFVNSFDLTYYFNSNDLNWEIIGEGNYLSIKNKEN